MLAGRGRFTKCNRVNYTIDVPGRRTKVVHVNDLKEHVAEHVVVRRVLLARDDQEILRIQ